MSTERIKGLKELREQLKQLGAIAGVKILASAAKASMKPVLEKAQQLVPVNLGVLRDSMKLKAQKPRSGRIVASAGITFAKGDITQQIDVETEGGEILSDKLDAKSAGWRRHLAEFGSRRQAAHPYLRPAMAAMKSKVIDIFKDEIRKKIEKAKRRQLAAEASGGPGEL